ncbi:hypothetical protein NFI96_027516 [Prochilodus magdalenae]|nr:hypothetical protein NFI96_027516 [Prochilodus magdalenae]
MALRVCLRPLLSVTGLRLGGSSSGTRLRPLSKLPERHSSRWSYGGGELTHRSLPTGRCPQDPAPQDTAHRTLPTGRCPTGRCPTGHCPQDAVHRTLPTGRRPQDAAHRTPSTGRRPQDATHRTLPTGRLPQDTAHRTPSTGCHPQDVAHRTLPTGHCPTGRCPQDLTHRTLPTRRHPQDAAHRTPPTGRCPQDAACCWLTVPSPAVTLRCPAALLCLIHCSSGSKVLLHFVNQSGVKTSVSATEGESLLDVVINKNLQIDGFGACEGTLACSTCHLICEDAVYEKMEPKTDEEMDMLDLAYGLTKTSRLGCQVTVERWMDGMTVRVPQEIKDQREKQEAESKQ